MHTSGRKNARTYINIPRAVLLLGGQVFALLRGATVTGQGRTGQVFGKDIQKFWGRDCWMPTCCARPEQESLHSGGSPTVRGQARRCVQNLFEKCFTSFDHYDRVLYHGSPLAHKPGFEPVGKMGAAKDELEFAKAPIMTFKHKVQAALQVALQYGARRAAKFTLRMMSGPFLHRAQGEGPKEIEQLVKRLSSQRSSRREEAACILAVYTDLEPTYRRRVLDEGALEKILPLLKSRSMGSRCAAADVLGQLARDPAVKKEILESGPVPRLTKLLRRRYNVR